MNTFFQGTLRRIQDSKGADYLAVVLSDYALLHVGWAHLADIGLEDAISARHTRDGVGNAHVTVMNVAEWGGIKKYKPELLANVEYLLETPVSFTFHGIGHAMGTNMVNLAWYGILSCETMMRLRDDLCMRAKDFHVTMAFSPKDVFDSPKGLATMLVPVAQLLDRPLEYQVDVEYGRGLC